MPDVIPKPLIFIAEPIFQSIGPKIYENRKAFWWQVAKDVMCGYYAVVTGVYGPREGIRAARRKAIMSALANDQCTHILFFDDDIFLKPSILLQFAALDRHIVGALLHKSDGTPIVFRDVGSAHGEGVVYPLPAFANGEEVWVDHPSGVFECAAVGAGVMMIETGVLRKMIAHYSTEFLFNYDASERSMDVRFCQMARRMGYMVSCDAQAGCTQKKHE